MEQIKYYFDIYKKQILLITSISCVLLIASITFFIINKKYNTEEIILEEEKNVTAMLDEKNINSANEEPTPKVKVDIKGCIKKPGVYEIGSNKRVIDAIELAGGLTENAYTASINLSQKLNDEDVIIIYSKEEYKTNQPNDKINILEKSNKSSVITKTETKTTSNTIKKPTNNNSTNNDSSNTIVNINSASKNTLMTLNGIGESKAEKIIEYRNTNGNFKSIEELKNVNGIGDAIYAKIKDNITI